MSQPHPHPRLPKDAVVKLHFKGDVNDAQTALDLQQSIERPLKVTTAPEKVT